MLFSGEIEIPKHRIHRDVLHTGLPTHTIFYFVISSIVFVGLGWRSFRCPGMEGGPSRSSAGGWSDELRDQERDVLLVHPSGGRTAGLRLGTRKTRLQHHIKRVVIGWNIRSHVYLLTTLSVVLCDVFFGSDFCVSSFPWQRQGVNRGRPTE